MCLIAAVPLNVICKLSDNQTPFPDCDATNQLIAAKNFDAFIQAAGLIDLPASPVSASGSTGLLTKSTPVWDDATNTHWTKIANICALSGSVAISAFAVLKAKFNQGWPGYAAPVGYGLCYFPYVAPDIIGVVQNWYQPKTNWYNIMNCGLATCGLIKSFVDIKLVKPASNPANVPNTSSTDPKVDSPNEQPVPNPAPPAQLPADQAPDPKWRKPFSDGDGKSTWSWNDASPFFEAGINLAWEVPVVAAYLDSDKKTNAILECTGNTMFNFGGVISFGSTFGAPNVALVTLIAQVVCNQGYGAMLFATSFDPKKCQ